MARHLMIYQSPPFICYRPSPGTYLRNTLIRSLNLLPVALGRATFACALILLATLTTAPAAEAARGTVRDARGDANPSWDITRVVADNGQRALVVNVYYRAKLRLERPLGLLTSVHLDFGYPADSSTGDFIATVVRGNETEGGDYVRIYPRRGCRGLRAGVQIKRRRVVFNIPQRCFGGLAGRVRVSAGTYLVRGPSSRADSTAGWSRWIKRG